MNNFTHKRIIATAVLAMAIYIASFACRCSKSTKTFIASLDEVTAEFEVIKIDTVHYVGDTYKSPIVLSKLQVVHSFSGKLSFETIWMNNASGTDCQQGLFPEKIGERYILTGKAIEHHVFDKWIKDEFERKYLQVTTCGKTLLVVEADTVIGYINKNNDDEIWDEYLEIKAEDPDKATEFLEHIYHTRHHRRRYQFMAKSDFFELMESF